MEIPNQEAVVDAHVSVAEKEDLSWLLTLPLGGCAGAAVGVWTGAVLLGPLATCFGEGYLGAIVTGFVGGTVGIPVGICAAGKYMEKQAGSFKRTFWGTVFGAGIVSAGYCGTMLLLYEEPIISLNRVNAWNICAYGVISLIGGIMGFRYEPRTPWYYRTPWYDRW
jgi:hypothetical protein